MAKPLRWARPVITFIGLFVGLPLMTVVADVLDARSGCVRIDSWVRSHASTLPSTLSELKAYPPEYQSRLFAALPAATKSQIMAEHIAWFLGTESGLNSEQT